jgi:outer membrane protein assembly factor BamB
LNEPKTLRAARKPLRLWPGVALAAAIPLFWFALPLAMPVSTTAKIVSKAGAPLAALLIFVWWLVASRAPWLERVLALLAAVAGLAVASRFLHPGIAQGNLGFQFYLYAIPVVGMALVAWAVAARPLSHSARRVTLAATLLATAGSFTLLRSEGLTGDGDAQFAFRWAPTAEEQLLARGEEPVDALSTSAGNDNLAWPGFRGPERDGIVRDLRIATDWAASPPVEVWRRAVGPGVSSFAIGGGFAFTQEQRGEEEVVVAYRLTTGEPVWRHHDKTRFWDSHVGAGPRATPTLYRDHLYTFGATGLLTAFDATDGRVLWSRDAAADTGAREPGFGFTSSPLVTGDAVVVNTNTLAAYDLATGEPLWFGPEGLAAYSSPQLLEIDGIPQIVQITRAGAVGIAPTDGSLLWENPWPGIGILQPVSIEAGDLVVSQVDASAIPLGIRRLAVAREQGEWTVAERWTSNALKPSFSPAVVLDGYLYGFDGRILACVRLEDGQRRWKGGRYGSGQLLLLADQRLLLVLSEQGELALVSATPDAFEELARFPAIAGKTWNQPALAGDLLLIRNGQEMAAFRLPSRASRPL